MDDLALQRKRLQSVVSAMAEHRQKQPQAFKFPLPEDVNVSYLTREASYTVAHHNIVLHSVSRVWCWKLTASAHEISTTSRYTVIAYML